jgi:tRNA dimethylallyltransferase
MNIKPPKVVVIAGPTASGKSDLAIRLARTFNGEIISADSRQVYRGMDIGTGKVTKREQKLALHWLLDVASPTRQYSVARFKRDAQKAIRDIVRRGKLPIICGGTGFWIDALVYDAQLPNIKPNPRFRKLMEAQPTEALVALLRARDPIRAQTIDTHNRRRIIRALEIIEATGQRIPKLTYRSPYELLYIGISVDNDTLRRRITRRLDARLRAGMIAEVKRLRLSGVSWERLESFGLEYRWVGRYLHGECSRAQMRDSLLADIVRYAKRQMTWWRTNDDIRWTVGPAQAERLVRTFVR